jgi:hypothetical protein
MTDVAIPQAQQAILDEHAEAIRKYAKRSITDLIEIGRHLAEVKKILGYTNWVPWLEREFRWSETQAERFIALHGLRRLVPNVGDWDVPISVLYLLAEKSTSPELIEAVAAKAEAGERVTITEVMKVKAKRKPRLPSYVPTRNAEQGAAAADLDLGAAEEKAVTTEAATTVATAQTADVALAARLCKLRDDAEALIADVRLWPLVGRVARRNRKLARERFRRSMAALIKLARGSEAADV